MESDNLRSTLVNPNNHTRIEIDQKVCSDEILRCTKELENFLNYNQKLRHSVNELIQAYLLNNEDRLKASYNEVKMNLKSLENNYNSVI